MFAETLETASGALDSIEDDHVGDEDEFSSISVGEILFVHVRRTSRFPQDAMGSVIGMADAAGAATATIKYDSFGNVTSASGSGAPIPGSVGTDFRYHGMQLDRATGLYHVRARTYDARTGRFTSRDPVDGRVQSPESYHPYVFANGNSHVWGDPTGLYAAVAGVAGLAIGISINVALATTAVALTGVVYLNYLKYARPTLGPSQDASTETQPREGEQRPKPIGPDVFPDIGRDETDPERWDIWRAQIVSGQPDLKFTGPISDWTAIGYLLGARPKSEMGQNLTTSRNVWASTGRRVLQVAPWPTGGAEIDKDPNKYLDEDGDYKNGGMRYCHFHDVRRKYNAHLFFGPFHRRPPADSSTCLAY